MVAPDSISPPAHPVSGLAPLDPRTSHTRTLLESPHHMIPDHRDGALMW